MKGGRLVSGRALSLAALACLAAGCHFGRHTLSDPMRDQVVKAESGDRFFLKLPAGGPEGLRWTVKSDDDDVTVSARPGTDSVGYEIRVHRGFDGPANVTFTPRQRSGTPPEPFTVALFRRTGNFAFWK